MFVCSRVHVCVCVGCIMHLCGGERLHVCEHVRVCMCCVEAGVGSGLVRGHCGASGRGQCVGKCG